jgi:UDP-N-acetylmuramoyl-L-alanyl-D-glutamate--2,6-diaminopimelate ligase
VDYAHTPDALNNVISTINQILQGNGRLITVVGCGGNRDKGKRPLMGAIAEEFADVAVVTDDNPRTEEPRAIINDIRAVKTYMRENNPLLEIPCFGVMRIQ